MPGTTLLDRVQTFCLSLDLGKDFEDFAKTHHGVYLDAINDDKTHSAHDVENRLEYTEIYNLFLEEFEEKINKFIGDEGGTNEGFLKEIGELDKEDSRNVFVDALLAITKYEHFHTLMIEEARKYVTLRSCGGAIDVSGAGSNDGAESKEDSKEDSKDSRK